MEKVLVYSTQRAASTFVLKLTKDIANYAKISHFSFNDEKIRREIKPIGWAEYISNKNCSGIFGPIRPDDAEPSFSEALKDYPIILHLRDPRDVLTSIFYSHAFAHPMKKGRFDPSEKERQEWINDGVDKYVLQKLPLFKKRFSYLCTHLIGLENMLFLKYEEMVTSYDTWLEKYLKVILKIDNNLDKFDSTYKHFYEQHKNDFKIDIENVTKQKRQVTPGDYKRKLKNETIETLNLELKYILDTLDY